MKKIDIHRFKTASSWFSSYSKSCPQMFYCPVKFDIKFLGQKGNSELLNRLQHYFQSLAQGSHSPSSVCTKGENGKSRNISRNNAHYRIA